MQQTVSRGGGPEIPNDDCLGSWNVLTLWQFEMGPPVQNDRAKLRLVLKSILHARLFFQGLFVFPFLGV